MKSREQLLKSLEFQKARLKDKELMKTNRDLFGGIEEKRQLEEQIKAHEEKVNFAAYCIAYYDNMVKKGIDMGSRLVRITDEIATIKRQTDSAVMTVAQRKAVFHQKAFHLVSEMEVLNNILDA
jgi:hypothetical protein